MQEISTETEQQHILQLANQFVRSHANVLISHDTFVKLVEAPTDAGLEAWLKSDAVEKNIQDSVYQYKIRGARKYERLTKQPIHQAYTLLEKNKLSTGILFDQTAVPALACLITTNWSKDTTKWAPDFIQNSS